MKYYKRGWLNKKKGVAFFEADVAYTKNYGYVDATFCLSDCFRKIQLDFSTGSEKDFKNNSHKIETLIVELQAFEAEYHLAYVKMIKNKEKKVEDTK